MNGATARTKELEAIFEAMVDGVIIYDKQEQVVQMNPAMRKLLGIDTVPDYESQPVAERKSALVMRDENGVPLPEEQWPQRRILQGEILTGQKTVDIFVRTWQGYDRQLNVSGAPIRDANGEISGAVAICRDVTERRQLERYTSDALNSLLELAETLMQAPSTVYLLSEAPLESDVDIGTIRHLLELTRNILGCKRVAILSVDEEDGDTLQPVAAVGLRPDQERSWLDDQRAWMRLSQHPDPAFLSRLLRNEVMVLDMMQPQYRTVLYGVQDMLVAPLLVDEQLIGILTLDHGPVPHSYELKDIALTGITAKLISLVLERERLMHERTEARAREMALREAQRRMEEFLSVASHELRTPITTIKASVQLSQRWSQDLVGHDDLSGDKIASMQKLLVRAERQVDTLNRLVNDLLDVSRIQLNRLRLRRTLCDLTHIVCETVNEQRQVTPTRMINVEIPPNCEAVPIFADAERIGQVVTSYLTNALKYSAAGLPVAVRVRKESEQGVRVSVHDQGPGLTSEEQQHVWERFYQSERIKVRSGSSVGLGLGLYICRTIIEEHQGQVGVDSVLDQGSTFWFTLPIVEIEDPASTG